MPAFPGQQLNITNLDPNLTDAQHIENYRLIMYWANKIPVTKLAETRLLATTASITIGLPILRDVGFTHLKIYTEAFGTDAGDQGLFVQMNGDTGANYAYQFMNSTAAVAPASNVALAQTSTRCGIVAATGSSVGAVSEFTLYNYARTYAFKSLTYQAGIVHGALQQTEVGTGQWGSAAAISSLKFTPQAGSFTTNSSIIVHGVF